jgi:diguanylate cyclase (GGDEF)-like protein/PAS domain S-box-containing protein
MEDQALSKIKRQKTLNRLRKKVAEVKDLQSAHSDMGQQIKHTISLLNATLESAANGLLVIDNSGKIASYNKNFLKMWQIPEALAGQGDDRAMVEYVLDQLQEPDAFLKKIRNLYAHPEKESFDIITFKDGRVFERFSRPQRVGSDVVGRVWSFHDVTERMQAAKALERSRAEFEAIFNSIADAAIFVDTRLRIVLINPAFTRIFGYRLQELKGKSTRILYADKADYSAEGMKRVHPDTAREKPAFECRYRRKDGTVFPAETVAAPVIDAKGLNRGFLSIHRDITERKRIEEALRESEEQFRMLLNSTAEAIYGIDMHGNCTFCNTSFLRQMLYEKEEDVLGKNMHELIHDRRLDGVAYPFRECRICKGFAKGKGVHSDEEVLWRADRSPFHAEYWSYPIRHRGGVIGAVVTFLDISERKRIGDALKASEAKYRALFTEMLNGFAYHKIIVDEHGMPSDYVFLEVNEAFEKLTGLNKKDIIGKAVTEVIPGIRQSDFDWIGTYGKVALSGEGAKFEQFSSALNRWYSVSAFCTEKGYFGAVFEDVTERRRMDDDIRYLAYHDTLTGLSNRGVFIDHLDLAITQAHRDSYMLAVLFLDLDRFKHINDAFGHAAGDQLLKEVAARLRKCVRETDTVSRIGGDEFSVLLPHIRHAEDAALIAEKIISAVQELYVIDAHELHITTSIGISTYPDDSIQPETLLNSADIAMYHAKQMGRGGYQFYSPVMKARTIERMIFDKSMRKALDRGEFLVYYQPQVDIMTKKMVCAEALVRWQHPELGLVTPGRFIPLAEASGIIKVIGDYVLQTACLQNRIWQEAGRPPFCVTVNLSSHEFQNPGIVERITRVLKETGLEPHLLELEITESTAMQDAPGTIRKLQELADMGIQFSLDDFGIGYSSLSYLKKFPINKLKIDQSFIRSILEDQDARAIVNAVVALAHSLNLSVVAEGVETDEQMHFLESCHCDQIQGYLFSKPLPVVDFQKFAMTH